MTTLEGIKGLNGREPVGAALTIGVKDKARGFPTETDRFHLVAPREENGRRAPMPAFSGFNSAAPEARKVIRGNLVHASRSDCFECHLKNQVGPRGAHPNRRPFCIGDGVRAVRWLGGDADNFADIDCPNKRCEFRIAPDGKPVPCKPWLRLLFRLRWKDGSPLPQLLVKFASGSWNTAANAVGFFEYIDDTAKHLGLTDYSLFGLPFTMTLIRQTKASSKSAFPVVGFSPEIDPVSWFMQQRAQLRELGAPTPIAALSDERDIDVVASDHVVISVPS